MEDIIGRVTRMEEATNAMSRATEVLERALEQWSEAREVFQEVKEYYYSETWQADRELSHTEALPREIPQGVLSEDTIYDVLSGNHWVALELIDKAMKSELKRADEEY